MGPRDCCSCRPRFFVLLPLGAAPCWLIILLAFQLQLLGALALNRCVPVKQLVADCFSMPALCSCVPPCICSASLPGLQRFAVLCPHGLDVRARPRLGGRCQELLGGGSSRLGGTPALLIPVAGPWFLPPRASADLVLTREWIAMPRKEPPPATYVFFPLPLLTVRRRRIDLYASVLAA